MREGRYVPGVRLEGEPSADARVFAFRGRRLLVHEEAEAARVPSLGKLERLAAVDDKYAAEHRLFLGRLDGHEVFAAELPGRPEGPEADRQRDTGDAPDGMAFRGLRRLYTRLDEDFFNLAGRAIQLVDWYRDHRFCGRCRTPTEDHDTERSKRCPECGLTCYPRLSPAVIVLVEDGDRILLARSAHFPPGMYSTLAGFVEPGETLEQTVVREIEEEVGVLVGDIRYFGSQPWPFPNSLMIGFTARYVSGEIALHDDEIEDAAWFTAENLPIVPPRISIARALIDSFLERE